MEWHVRICEVTEKFVMNKKLNKILLFAFIIVIFSILIFFYVCLYPIAVFDTDDWAYIYQLRAPIPWIKAWNPIKVFPETFMPLVSYIGAYCFYPFVGDYCFALSTAHGIFISIILTVYFAEFVLLIFYKTTASEKQCIFIGSIFFALHFLVLINWWSDNLSLLYAYNLTCVYNYTLSTILNAGLVMFTISHGGVNKIFCNGKTYDKSIFIIWCYFSINSNLFSSIVLASYIGANLLLNLKKDLKDSSFDKKIYMNNNKISLIIICCWLVSHVIERTGGRSGGRVGSFFHNLSNVIVLALDWITRINILVLVFTVIVLIIWIKKVNSTKDQVSKILMVMFFTFAYISLLCAVVDSVYMRRPEVILALAFWGLFSVSYCFNALVILNKKYAFIAVILLLAAQTVIINPRHVFKYVNYNGFTYSQSEALMNDIIEQFVTAEAEENYEIDLFVPKFDTDDNWPIATYASDRFSSALFKHKVILHKIKVNRMVPSIDNLKILEGAKD